MGAEGVFWVRDDDTPVWAEKVVICLDIEPGGYSEYEIFLPKAPVSVALEVDSYKPWQEGSTLFKFYYESYLILLWALSKGLLPEDMRCPPRDTFENWVEEVTFIQTVVDEVPEMPDMSNLTGSNTSELSVVEGMDDNADKEGSENMPETIDSTDDTAEEEPF